ncbi:MAG: formylglycine-generating enzyme family protein [Victivallales bacterium]|nr:formylglycine-generating enzyme family protein [Victivallales bacterium]
MDGGSFFGVLRARTGLTFDLPTEAQWEYACRAGTTTALNSGENLTDAETCPNMNEVGRYKGNQNDGKGDYKEHTKVGCYLPNAWGLYDCHGNVWEWCLDWYQSGWGKAVDTDPVGATSGSVRVLRGGGWLSRAGNCRSASCDSFTPSYSNYYGYGFRVACWPLVR